MYPVVKSKKFFFLNEKSAWLSAFIGNLITVPLVFFLKKKIFISPNLISIIGGFIFFASAINFYFFPNYNYLCSIGFFISYLLDSTDGKLARIRGMKNKSGAILDSTIDLLCHSVGLLIVCLALSKHVGSHTPLIILLPYVAFLTYAHIRDLKLILFKKKNKIFKKKSDPNTWQKFCWEKGLNEYPYNDWETIYISILVVSINLDNPIIFLLFAVNINLIIKIYLFIKNKYL